MALADGYGLGLGEIASGRLLFDYHTAQTPPHRQESPLRDATGGTGRRRSRYNTLGAQNTGPIQPILWSFGCARRRGGTSASWLKL